jgi:hypothetical protein
MKNKLTIENIINPAKSAILALSIRYASPYNKR